MRFSRVLTLPVVVALCASFVAAQGVAPPSGKTLASTVGVYVFPNQGQKPDQQSKDESECYSWGVQQTGADPFDVQKTAEQQKAQQQQQMEQAKQTGRGSGARGAVGGAAAGALIGEIASDDAGKGAATGAAVGLIAGRRRGRAAQNQAVSEAKSTAASQQQASAQQIEAFRKAFSVCLEAKHYMVKF